MYVLTASGSVRSVCLARCLSRLPVAFMVVSSYAFFFMYHNVEKVGDAVISVGDDVAVPD